jgi:diguanylate cyclase (GGDEF)-like protein
MADHPDAGASPEEQRAHERLPLQKNVLLIARGMSQRACRMKDICAGGALVELHETGEGRDLHRGEVVLLRLLLGEGENASAHELRARIAHVDRQLFGVSFFNPDPATLGVLLDAARGTQEPAPAPELSGSARELIERLGQQLLGYCGTVLGTFFKRADEQLLEAVAHAHSSSEQRQFFDAATLLRQQRDTIRLRYQRELKQAFDRPALAEPDVSDLATSDREQFEAWLVVKVIAARAEEKCREVLDDLQARLESLLGGAAGNPFAPLVLCAAFQRAIAPQKLPPSIEKALYRSFEDAVLGNLCEAYGLLARTLEQHDVQPQQRDAGPPPSPSAQAAAPARLPAGKPEAPRSAAEFLARAGLPAGSPRPRLLAAPEALQQLLALHRQLLGPSAAPDTGTQSALALPGEDGNDPRRIFAMLKAAHEGWKPALEKLVQHAGGETGGRLLALQPFTEQLLQALAEDGQLGDAGRQWLHQLELPLLQVFMADDGFFRDAAHPVRQLLDHLARLGLRDCPLTANQRATIDQQVERIARDFDHDGEVFTAALQELEPLAAWLEQTATRNTERVCQMAAGEQRLADARLQVQDALDARLAGRRVPQPLLTLLDAGWRDLLVNTCLREGLHSQRFQEYLGLIDELLAIGADVHRRFDLRGILRRLKTGLQETVDSGGARLQQQAVTELKPLLGGPQRLVGDVAWVAVPARKSDGDADEERWLQKWLERGQRLQVGDWLELRHRGGEAECLRLAWRDERGQRFVFVNRQGIKAGSFSRRELASLMHAGNVLGGAGASTPLEGALAQAGHRLYEKLAWQLSHDPLTGLANRAEFMRQLERAMESARRRRAHHVLACISLDRFDDIHNTARAVADQLLKSVANLLGKALAPRTIVARLQDDRFALLLEDCELGKAQQLFSLRLGELAAMRLNYEGEIYKLTASAGLVDITYTSEAPAQMLRAADAACADARGHGGNRIQVYQPTAEEQARRDGVVVWVTKLNQALEAEQLALRCQRIRPLAAGRDEQRYEILLGIQGEGTEDLPPGEFVQAAERYNRMLAVDRWVVEHTLRWCREHPEKFARLGMVSVNLSAHSLTDVQTLPFLLDRLLAYGLPPERFCFEISETAAMDNIADAADLMQELGRIGCRFALDDFGAGHLSCHHLRHLPLDYVKIDGSFVRDLAEVAADDAMVRAIHALAHYFGLQTIAEYAENEAVLQRLTDMGVDFAQGYGIEKPRWLDSL